MASIRAFLDTSGFYALLINRDHAHTAAVDWRKSVSPQRPVLITTGLVLSETATLFKARGYNHLLPGFFNFLKSTHALQIQWMEEGLFALTQEFFLRHDDHDYSFTDCTSFVVMHKLQMTHALTTDRHFREAGFAPVLPVI